MLVLEEARIWVIVPRHVLRGQVWVLTGSLCFQIFNQAFFCFQNILNIQFFCCCCAASSYQFNVVVILASLPPSYLLFIQLILPAIKTIYFQGFLNWILILLTHHAHPVACYSSVCTIIPGGTLIHFYLGVHFYCWQKYYYNHHIS